MKGDDILFKKPGAEAMSRNTKGDVMPQTEALAYASALPPVQRSDVSGCYCLKCVPCGSFPIATHCVCGGDSLCWGCGTIPFACCSIPMPFIDPYFRSIKRDCTVMLVDAERGTLACYPGEKAEKPCCIGPSSGERADIRSRVLLTSAPSSSTLTARGLRCILKHSIASCMSGTTRRRKQSCS